MQTMNEEPQEVRASVLNAAGTGTVDSNVLRFDTLLNKSLTPAAGTPPNLSATTTVENGTRWFATRRGLYVAVLSIPVMETGGDTVSLAISLNATNLNAAIVLNAGGMLKTTDAVVPINTQVPAQITFGVQVFDGDLLPAQGNLAIIRFHGFSSGGRLEDSLALALAQAQVIYMGDTRG